jgi:alpha-glucosidase
MRFVPIMDAGIAVSDSYEAYKDGVSKDVFIKAGSDNKTDFVGQVWPGDSVYPDFTKNETVLWW